MIISSWPLSSDDRVPTTAIVKAIILAQTRPDFISFTRFVQKSSFRICPVPSPLIVLAPAWSPKLPIHGMPMNKVVIVIPLDDTLLGDLDNEV